MIRVKDLVPGIYYEESRDFQVFGNTFEAVFNYLKTNVDLINENPLDRRSSILVVKLIAKTLGFDSKHEYDMDDLRTICSIFIECVRSKGTKESIEKAVSGLLNSQHITSGFKVIPEDNEVKIYLPKSVRDVVLLEDLFDYILPAGITYNFIYGTFALENLVETKVGTTDSVVFKEMQNASIGTIVSAPDVPHINKTTPANLEGYDSSTKLSQTYTGATGSIASEEESNNTNTHSGGGDDN